MNFTQDEDTLQPPLAEGTHPLESEQSVKIAKSTGGNHHERLEKLYGALQALMANKFTGYLKLNFTQGTLGRVEKFEEILRK